LIHECISQNGNSDLDPEDLNTLKSFLMNIRNKNYVNDFSYETQTTNGRTRRFLNSTGESIVTSVGEGINAALLQINAALPQINAALRPEVVNILQNVRKAYVEKAISNATEQLKRGENVNQNIDETIILLQYNNNESDAKKYLGVLNILFKSDENFLKYISNEESIISEYKRVIQILENELVPLLNENNNNHFKRLSSLINIFYVSIGGYSLYESTLIGQLLFQLTLTTPDYRRYLKDEAEKMWNDMNKENEEYVKKHKICNVEESKEELLPAKVEFLKAMTARWRNNDNNNNPQHLIDLLINLIANGSPTPQLDTINVYFDDFYIPEEEEEFEEDREENSQPKTPTGSPSRYASQPTPGTTASDRNFIPYSRLTPRLQGRFTKLHECFTLLMGTPKYKNRLLVVPYSEVSNSSNTWRDVHSEGSQNNSGDSTPYTWRSVLSLKGSQDNSEINMGFLDEVENDEKSDDGELTENPSLLKRTLSNESTGNESTGSKKSRSNTPLPVDKFNHGQEVLFKFSANSPSYTSGTISYMNENNTYAILHGKHKSMLVENVDASLIIPKNPTGGSRKHRKKYTRKPKFTRRKNKKSPKRKTIKKRKMPKRNNNKTRRQRK
jgi:hypothetical protein